jgi:hypothetical protein
MPEQLSFAGLDASSKATDGVFFAIFPVVDVGPRIV